MSIVKNSTKTNCLICGGTASSIKVCMVIGNIPFLENNCYNCGVNSAGCHELFINKHFRIVWDKYCDKFVY